MEMLCLHYLEESLGLCSIQEETLGQTARVRGESKERVGKEAPGCQLAAPPASGIMCDPPFWLIHVELQEPLRGVGDLEPP